MMFYVGLLGVFLAGTSFHEYLHTRETKYFVLYLFEGVTGVLLVMLNA